MPTKFYILHSKFMKNLFSNDVNMYCKPGSLSRERSSETCASSCVFDGTSPNTCFSSCAFDGTSPNTCLSCFRFECISSNICFSSCYVDITSGNSCLFCSDNSTN